MNITDDQKSVIIKLMLEHYPEIPVFLVAENPFQLLVAVILSAQTTDRQVNRVLPGLFARFPDALSLAAADLHVVEDLIGSVGFFRMKAAHIVGTAKALVSRFDGNVPDSMEALLSLPGVGRKTANVILGSVFNKPAVIVDTHFGRVCRRLGLSESLQPEGVESDLLSLLEPSTSYHFSMVANNHGRIICHARKPLCTDCFLAQVCPSADLI